MISIYLDIETTGNLATWPPSFPTIDEHVLDAARADVERRNAKRKPPRSGEVLDAEIATFATEQRERLAAGHRAACYDLVGDWATSAVEPLEATVSHVVALVVYESKQDAPVLHWCVAGPALGVVDEEAVLASLCEQLLACPILGASLQGLPVGTRVVTWRGTTFDAPMLHLRALRYREHPWSRLLMGLCAEHYQHDLHEAALTKASRYEQRLKWVNSTRLADYLGIELQHETLGLHLAGRLAHWMTCDPLDVIHGRHLPVLTALGEYQAVEDKCRADVQELRDLDLALRRARGAV